MNERKRDRRLRATKEKLGEHLTEAMGQRDGNIELEARLDNGD